MPGAPKTEQIPLLRQNAQSSSWSVKLRTWSGCSVTAAVIGFFIIFLLFRYGFPRQTEITQLPEWNLYERISSHSGPEKITRATLPDVGGSSNNGFLATVEGAVKYFHIEGTCSSVQKPSLVAGKSGCRYAVNGGPFNNYFHGGCIGPVISHSKVLNEDWGTSYASFGLTADGHWLIGQISQDTVKKEQVAELVTGLGGWLVRNGEVVASEGGQVAGRTAVGVDQHGRLLLLQVDGCENCFSPGGMTLADFAKLLVKNGALHAINLDGGGSSVSVADGKVLDRPTGLIMGIVYERPVTSVVCLT